MLCLECRGGSAAAPPSLLGLLRPADKLRINSPFDFIPEKSQLLGGKAELEGLSRAERSTGHSCRSRVSLGALGKGSGAGRGLEGGQSPRGRPRARGVTPRNLPKGTAAAGWKTPPVPARNYRHTGTKVLAKDSQRGQQGAG